MTMAVDVSDGSTENKPKNRLYAYKIRLNIYMNCSVYNFEVVGLIRWIVKMTLVKLNEAINKGKTNVLVFFLFLQKRVG